MNRRQKTEDRGQKSVISNPWFVARKPENSWEKSENSSEIRKQKSVTIRHSAVF